MRGTFRARYVVTASVLWLGACGGNASTQQRAPRALHAAPVDPSRARITILYDAFGDSPGMRQDWGYSTLIEYGGKRILFDTGNNGDILTQNAKAKDVDLTQLDFVVISHRHGDHIGGLTPLLALNPNVKIYAPKEGLGVFGSDLPSTFYRKDNSVPAEQRYYDGKPPEIMRFGTAWPGANIQLVDKIVDVATRIHSRIHMLVGGFHLVVADDPEIARIITLLHDTYKVEYVASGHCTGEVTFAALKKGFGDHALYAGLGTVFALDATPHAMADSR